MTNINLAAVEMNGCNQTVFVAADVEDDQIANLFG